MTGGGWLMSIIGLRCLGRHIVDSSSSMSVKSVYQLRLPTDWGVRVESLLSG